MDSKFIEELRLAETPKEEILKLIEKIYGGADK